MAIISCFVEVTSILVDHLRIVCACVCVCECGWRAVRCTRHCSSLLSVRTIPSKQSTRFQPKTICRSNTQKRANDFDTRQQTNKQKIVKTVFVFSCAVLIQTHLSHFVLVCINLSLFLLRVSVSSYLCTACFLRNSTKWLTFFMLNSEQHPPRTILTCRTWRHNMGRLVLKWWVSKCECATAVSRKYNNTRPIRRCRAEN